MSDDPQRTASARPRLRVGVLASGRGSNLQALLDAGGREDFPAEVVVVISDRETALALARAAVAGVPRVVVNPKDHPDRAAYDAALLARLAEHRVELTCLAGFMRILGPAFVRSLAGRLMNVHPSLLPAFPGLSAQRRALEHGVKIAGATIHFVDEGVDTGAIITQASVPVHEDDSEPSLAARILAEEHRLYPEAVRLFALGCLRIEGRRVAIQKETEAKT